jgi:quercetin dioxygenase-like cupin family protein/NAD-dependent dihydropyrimidine dehydrogenase PreA subunit
MEWPVPLVDAMRCTGCGLCVAACVNGVLFVQDQRAVVLNPIACVYVGNCELICPGGAIARPFQVFFVEQTVEYTMQTTVVLDWKDRVIFSADAPQPQVLGEDEKLKVIVAGLEPGAEIPVHSEGLAMYHILEGAGWMTVDDRRFAIQTGMIILTPEGATRGIEAVTRLAFLATRIA